MSAARAAEAGEVVVGCKYEEEHPRIEARLEEHERRLAKLENEGREDLRELWRTLGKLQQTVENMRGYLAGALLAATLVGGIISFVAAKVFS